MLPVWNTYVFSYVMYRSQVLGYMHRNADLCGYNDVEVMIQFNVCSYELFKVTVVSYIYYVSTEAIQCLSQTFFVLWICYINLATNKW